MLLKSAPSISKSRHPVIMPRPSSKCYIFEMETIKVICFSEKCFILNPEEKNTQAFIRSLKAQFRLSATNFIRSDEKNRYILCAVRVRNKIESILTIDSIKTQHHLLSKGDIQYKRYLSIENTF